MALINSVERRRFPLVYDIFVHRVEVPMNAYLNGPGAVRGWLSATLGDEYDRWALLGPSVYGFKSEQDKTLFILRWL